MKITDIATRIKWKPVLALLLVIIIAAYFLFGGQISSPFQQKWKGEGDVKAMSWADPSGVEIDGTSKAKVVVKNEGDDLAEVRVKLAADDQGLAFEEGGNSQAVNTSISIEPDGSRELSFKVNFNANWPGRYWVNVTISAPGGNIVDRIAFDLREKK